MKKILIIVCFFLLNVSAQADRQERRFSNFNKWLVQNEFKEFYKLGFGEAKGKCKDLEKFRHEINIYVGATPVWNSDKSKILDILDNLKGIYIGKPVIQEIARENESAKIVKKTYVRFATSSEVVE